MPRRPKEPGEPESETASSARTSSALVEGAPPRATPRHVDDLNLVCVKLRGDWSWIVVVPAEPGFSTAEIAHSLSQVGRRLSAGPVDFIQAYDLDEGSAAWLVDLLKPVAGPDAWPDEPRTSRSTTWTKPVTRTVVTVQSPLSHPQALPIALAADGVVLCVRRGRTLVESVRKTIAAVGADRVLCCVLID